METEAGGRCPQGLGEELTIETKSMTFLGALRGLWRKRFLWPVLVVFAIGLAGAAGYSAGAAHGAWIMPVQRRIALEYFITEDSFSEIENTRAKLSALGCQYLTEVRMRHHASALQGGGLARTANPAYVSDVGHALVELEQGIEQFKGTEPELSLVQELLYLLKREQQQERWLDVYRRVLYEHPTAPVVRANLRFAQEMSARAGRQAEIAAACDFLGRIPIDFPAKHQIPAPGLTVTFLSSGATQGLP